MTGYTNNTVHGARKWSSIALSHDDLCDGRTRVTTSWWRYCALGPDKGEPKTMMLTPYPEPFQQLLDPEAETCMAETLKIVRAYVARSRIQIIARATSQYSRPQAHQVPDHYQQLNHGCETVSS